MKDGILHPGWGVYMDRVLGSIWRRIAYAGVHYRPGMCPKGNLGLPCFSVRSLCTSYV